MCYPNNLAQKLTNRPTVHQPSWQPCALTPNTPTMCTIAANVHYVRDVHNGHELLFRYCPCSLHLRGGGTDLGKSKAQKMHVWRGGLTQRALLPVLEQYMTPCTVLGI